MNQLDRLPLGSLAKRSLVLLSGSGGAQLIVLISLPLVTRLFTPSELGQGELFAAVLTTLAAIACLRMEYAMLLVRSYRERGALFRVCVATACCMAAFAMVLLAALTLFYGREKQSFSIGILPLLGFGIVFSGFLLPARTYLLRVSAVATLARLTLLRSVMLVGLRVGLGIAGLGVIGLMAAEVVAIVLLSIAALWSSRVYQHMGIASVAEVREIWSRHRSFALFESPATLVSTANLFLPLPIIVSVYGVAAGGIYALAFRLITGPTNQIAVAAGDIFQTEAARQLRAERFGQFRRLTLRFLFALIALATAIVAVVYFVSSYLPLIFGEGWSEITIFVRIMLPWMWAALVIVPLSRIVSVTGQQQWKLVYDLCRVILLVACGITLTNVDWSITDGLALISAANTVGYIIYGCVLIKITTSVGSNGSDSR